MRNFTPWTFKGNFIQFPKLSIDIVETEKVETAATQYAVHLVNFINTYLQKANEYAAILMESIPSSSNFYKLPRCIIITRS